MTSTDTVQQQSRIVVAVDGSAASLEALAWAVRQAALTGAVAEVVTAWHYPLSAGGYTSAAEIDWQANAHATQDVAVKEVLGDDAASLLRSVVEGHPVPDLLDAAAGADLLVVGSRGHGGFAGLLLGSVSEHVVAHAPCAVVVVRTQVPDGASPDLSGEQS
jgi:nucleotide-binding universal stress UspA family protein